MKGYELAAVAFVYVAGVVAVTRRELRAVPWRTLDGHDYIMAGLMGLTWPAIVAWGPVFAVCWAVGRSVALLLQGRGWR